MFPILFGQWVLDLYLEVRIMGAMEYKGHFALVTVYCHLPETFISLGLLFLHCTRAWDQSQRKVICFDLYPFFLQLIIFPSSLSKPQSCEGQSYCGLQSTWKAFQKSNLFDYCFLDSF